MKRIFKLICKLSLCFISSNAFSAPLPNQSLTPGVVRTDLTLNQVCTTKWGKDHRAVTPAMKAVVFKSYGYPNENKDKRCPCEIDHLISRELGGADVIKNLWPQSYVGPWNARLKDRLENKLHTEVCAKRITLDNAQQTIRVDWTKAYIKYFGNPK